MKHYIKLIRIASLLAFFSVSELWSQNSTTATGDPMVYENHNQTDYSALPVKSLVGFAHDEQKVPIPNVSFGVFTDGDHRLIATFRSTSNGSFEFRSLAPGRYRLIAKYDGFCSANIPISISEHNSSKRGVDVHMRPAGIDTCSYGTVKRIP